MFKGAKRPLKVKLYEDTVTYVVNDVIPFGQCKERVSNCRRCYARRGGQEICVLKIVCTNCFGEHLPTDRVCPAREKAYQIKRSMVLDNLSYKEARARFATVFG